MVSISTVLRTFAWQDQRIEELVKLINRNVELCETVKLHSRKFCECREITGLPQLLIIKKSGISIISRLSDGEARGSSIDRLVILKVANGGVDRLIWVDAVG